MLQDVLNKIVAQCIEYEMNSGPQENHENHDTPEQQEAEEFMSSILDCFENEGVIQELQTFLRQKIILIIQKKRPTLFQAQSLDETSALVIQLIYDFLRCHKLLYSISILASETGNAYPIAEEQKGKLHFIEAENLLNELGITKDTEISRKILKKYSQSNKTSLLESMLPGTPDYFNFLKNIESSQFISKVLSNTAKQVRFEEDEDSNEKLNGLDPSSLPSNLEAQLSAIMSEMERSKQVQVKLAIQRYKEEELVKMYDEIETKLRFEGVAKEKELLDSYQQQANFMKSSFKNEKELWYNKKLEQEERLKVEWQKLQKRITHFEKLVARTMVGKSSGLDFFDDLANHSDRSGRDFPVEDHTTILPMELVQEAEYRAKIKKLQDEVADLSMWKCTTQKKQSHKPQMSDASTNAVDFSSSRVMEELALLQYQLEKQNEEISALREISGDSGLLLPKSEHRVEKVEADTPEADQDIHNEWEIEAFIDKAKRRYQKLETESNDLKAKLDIIKANREGEQKYKKLSKLKESKRPIVPVVKNSDVNSSYQQHLLSSIQNLNHQTMRQNIQQKSPLRRDDLKTNGRNEHRKETMVLSTIPSAELTGGFDTKKSTSKQIYNGNETKDRPPNQHAESQSYNDSPEAIENETKAGTSVFHDTQIKNNKGIKLGPDKIQKTLPKKPEAQVNQDRGGTSAQSYGKMTLSSNPTKHHYMSSSIQGAGFKETEKDASAVIHITKPITPSKGNVMHAQKPKNEPEDFWAI